MLFAGTEDVLGCVLCTARNLKLQLGRCWVGDRQVGRKKGENRKIRMGEERKHSIRQNVSEQSVLLSIRFLFFLIFC